MSTLLACTDGSLYSRSIYDHAAWAALQIDCGVQVLHVIERAESAQGTDLTGSLGFDASTELLEELVKLDEAHSRVARLRGKAILDDAARQLREAGVTDVTTTQLHGSVVETLDGMEDAAELIIIGKRGEHADFSKGHLGSNLERVARSARIPVLIAARAFKPIKSYLIAFDGGASALKAVHYAAANPLLKGAQAHLLAVGKSGSNLERDLEHAATGLRGAGVEVTVELLSGDPDEVIAAEVESRQIDLLVMGGYGHSRIRHLMLGSTTTGLIRTCRVPVLLFR